MMLSSVCNIQDPEPGQVRVSGLKAYLDSVVRNSESLIYPPPPPLPSCPQARPTPSTIVRDRGHRLHAALTPILRRGRLGIIRGSEHRAESAGAASSTLRRRPGQPVRAGALWDPCTARRPAGGRPCRHPPRRRHADCAGRSRHKICPTPCTQFILRPVPRAEALGFFASRLRRLGASTKLAGP